MASTNAASAAGGTSPMLTAPEAGGGHIDGSTAHSVALRAVTSLEAEEEAPYRLDGGRVAGRGPALKTAEHRQDEVRGGVLEDRVAALEVAFLRLRRPLPVLDRDPPLAAPATRDLHPVNDVDAPGGFLVDRVLHD